MTPTFTKMGKQILANGVHYADAADDAAATHILAKLNGEGWKPIETAPRDPDAIILAVWPSALQGKGTVCTAIWSETRREFSPWPSPMRGVKFTHWRPLPTPTGAA